ncbi:serpin-2-like protein [Leptotrombidium deliense]|uniref:Serpin-2-like protein n=1 Tax=Leptotrombidium deliense TaxID=299467 RepID=A0A443S9R8_9ACAR|nr:serpin-2-like protein [Leptotrombidium deliense]
MVRRATSYKYYRSTDHKAQFVQLPYKGDMSMYVVLPDEKDGLQKLVEGWTKDGLKDLIPQMNYTTMNLMLPKFEYDYQINLLATFDKMGIDIRPVWSSINPALFVSEALHKAKIKVHEAGTEAAAVTVISFTFLSAARPVKPVEFKVDRPFIFIIRDDISNVNLFVGTVNKL